MGFRTRIIVDLDAIEHNYNSVRAKMPNDCKILGVIKANGYGHGAVEIAKFLDNRCDFFGVATVDEAVELKKEGVSKPILVLGHVTKEDYSNVVKYDIRIPMFDYGEALELSNEAVRWNKKAYIHFCIDTGMSRIGFQVSEENADICERICALPNLIAEGLFSHYATADEKDLTKAITQRTYFKAFVSMLEERKIDIPIKHINNSAGIINFDQYFDMCRMGIILYGCYPSEDIDKSKLDIIPAMTWQSTVSYVKTLEAGREISYGGTYKTNETKIVATIPVGYADGYPRSLSNIGKVIINGKYAKILGRVCMDQLMVDVTDIEDVEEGTLVILVGSQGNASISIEEFANQAGSFNYEMLCRIDRRVPRVYLKNGIHYAEVNYLIK